MLLLSYNTVYFRWSYNCLNILDAITNVHSYTISRVYLVHVRPYKVDTTQDLFIDEVTFSGLPLTVDYYGKFCSFSIIWYNCSIKQN